MSRYAQAFYAVDLYGSGGAGTPLSSALSVTSNLYGQTHPVWTVPTGSWDKMRLLRNKAGVPFDESDGVVVSASDSAAPVTDVIDTGLLPSTIYYYAVFVRTIVGGNFKWVRAGAARGLSVGDHGYRGLLLDRLPRVFTSDGVSGPADSATDLAKFLNVFGFQVDAYRDRIDYLLDTKNADTVAAELLPAMMAELGAEYFDPVGMAQNRILARNTVTLSQTKGTTAGIEGRCSSTTGWAADVLPLQNLLMDRDDSSGRYSYGAWRVTSVNGTLGRAASPSIDTDGCVTLTTGTTATVVVELKGNNASAHGIPLEGGVTYVFSVAMKNEAGFAPTIGGTWYGNGAAPTGTVGATSSAADPVDGTWTRYTATVTPSGTTRVLFVPKITFTSLTSGTSVKLTQGFLGAGSSFTAYSYPRNLRIALTADRINEVLNAGFDTNATLWTAATCTLARVTTPTYDSGVGSGQITLGAASGSVTATAYVDALKDYTLSARLRSTGAQSNTAQFNVVFKTAANVQVGPTVVVLSTPQAFTGTSWVRPYGVVTVPATAVKADVTVAITGALNDVVYLDDVLLERTSRLQDYFDTKQQGSNVVYEGTASLSRAHFYRNRASRVTRLNTVLPDNVPLNATYSLLSAQPR